MLKLNGKCGVAGRFIDRLGRLFGAKNKFYALDDVGFPGIGCAHDYVSATLKKKCRGNFVLAADS
ncbi:hypothetical protein BAY1663_03768 [Pseudomonas sp. BAY1663]|nr:hypothetical protein BAY1663_03768 [Pseudomonas sp. BAY1663]